MLIELYDTLDEAGEVVSQGCVSELRDLEWNGKLFLPVTLGSWVNQIPPGIRMEEDTLHYCPNAVEHSTQIRHFMIIMNKEFVRNKGDTFLS